jgi:8-oxo-dGTP pyrophosphatase MutT (NUDIX family)
VTTRADQDRHDGGRADGDGQAEAQMTTSDVRGGARVRDVYFHDPAAPVPTVVVPSVFVAVRAADGRLLLVQRCDSGDWELPGGRVDVGESAIVAAGREVAEESGVVVHVTGLIGLYTDPGHIVRSVTGEVRQQFVVLFRASPVSGRPRADGRETSAAAWCAPQDLAGLPMQAPVRGWIRDALALPGPARVD